jgi:hypothetical protein
MSSPFTAEEKRAIELAGHALNCGVSDKWEEAAGFVKQLGEETGSDGVYVALIGWCDTYLGIEGVPIGAQTCISFQALECGAIGSADEVPADVAWAGRMLAARAADDADNWEALCEALPEDGHVVARHVMRLLEMCAYGIRRAKGMDR